MKRLKQGCLSALAAVAAIGISGSAIAEEPIKLKLSHSMPAISTISVKLIQPWAERVEKDSGGRIKVEIYPSMQIGGKAPQVFDQVRSGVADVGWTLPGYTSGRFPRTDVFELPFVTASTAIANTQAVWDFYQLHLKEEYKDVHVLLLHTNAPGWIHTTGKPVRTLEDIKGQKVRVPGKAIGEALKELGATPVGMPAPEIYEAMARGVLDGAAIPWSVVRPLRINELAKHHTETGISSSVFLFAMNKQKYDSLPKDLQEIIDRNSGANITQEIGLAFDEVEVSPMQQAKENGHGIYKLSPEERQRWEKQTKPVIEAWIKATPDGQALYDAALASIAKYEKPGQ